MLVISENANRITVPAFKWFHIINTRLSNIRRPFFQRNSETNKCEKEPLHKRALLEYH